MFQCLTLHSVAYESNDHIHPDGIYLDNNCNPLFLDSIESCIGRKKIAYMDLGCAGGELVIEMLRRGHTAVGLDGSDHCLNLNHEAVQKMGSMPLGYDNWQQHGNKNLFTCDITKDYTIINDGKFLQQFDIITCLDVIEHFSTKEQVDMFVKMVLRHLKPNGMFIAAITLFSMVKNNVEYHTMLRTTDEWNEYLSNYFKTIPYPLNQVNRGHHNHPELIYNYAGVKQ